MHEKPTSFDIAFLAGVRQPTVSRALRGSPVVSLETRKRIEEIARQLNYRVDKNASNLRSQHSNTLALLLFEDPTPDDSQINPFFLSMLGSITRASARQGYDLLISFQQLSKRLAARTTKTAARPTASSCSATATTRNIVRASNAGRTGHALRALGTGAHRRARRLRGLATTRRAATTSRVTCSRRAAARSRSSARHHPLSGILRSLSRLRTRHAGSAASPPRPRLQVDAINLEESGFQAANELRARGVEFDAIVAASDLIAIGALRALQESGIDVPRQVAVVGFDDIPAASLTNPPLTTVMQDTRRAGELLVETLLRQIAGEPAANSVIPRVCGAQVRLNGVRPQFASNRGDRLLFHAQREHSGQHEAHAADQQRVDRLAAEATACSSTPSTLAVTSCGITMKKLKMPMYTPILRDGTLSGEQRIRQRHDRRPGEADAHHRQQQPVADRG